MINELKIDDKTSFCYKAEPIVINGLDELKSKVSEVVQRNKNTVVTADTYKDDKKRKQWLSKYERAIDEKRREIGRKYREPVEDFNEVIKPIEKQISEVKDNINNQLKQFDDEEKERKKATILEFINESAPNYKVNPSDVEIYDKWLNKTYSKPNWEQDVVDQFKLLQKQEADKKIDKETLTALAESIDIDAEPYIHLLDENHDVMNIFNLMKEDKNKKLAKQAEEKAKREESTTVLKDKIVDNNTGEVTKLMTFTLEVKGTNSQLINLKKYMQGTGIAFKKIYVEGS